MSMALGRADGASGSPDAGKMRHRYLAAL